MPAFEKPDRRNAWLAGFSRPRSLHLIAALLFLSCVLAIFQLSFSIFHGTWGIWPDDLIYFNALEDWIHSGTSLRGYTLQPSPYLLDMLLDRIVILFTDDFEQYAHAVSAVVSVCFACSFLVLAYAYCRDWRRSVFIALFGLANLYLWLIPMRIHLHLFLPSHTFSSVGTPVAMAMLAMAVASESRRRHVRWCSALAILTVIITFSDPIFLAEFILPAAMTCVLLAIFPGTRISRLALAGFAPLASGITAMVLLEICNVFLWPHRVDVYPPLMTIVEGTTVQVNGNLGLAAFLMDKHYRTLQHLFIAAFVCAALWLVMQLRAQCAPWQPSEAMQKRRLEWVTMTLVALCASVTSVVMPALRASFETYYEWRYFLLASMFLSLAVAAVATYAACAAWSLLTAVAGKRLARPIRFPNPRLAGAVGVGLAAAVLLVTIGYSEHETLHVGDKRSPVTPYLSCVAKATEKYDLHDGLASAYVAMMLRAGRAAPQYRHAGTIFQTTFADLSSFLEPANNNLRWMSKQALQKDGGVDYVIFEEARDPLSAQNQIRQSVGEPTVIETCPHPDDLFREGTSRTFVWIYKDSAARAQLTNLVLRDNNQSNFFPPYKLGTLTVDPVLGAYSVPGAGEVRQGMRGWTRDANPPSGRFFQTKPIYLPPGKYRAHICLSTNDKTSQGPLASAEVSWGGGVLFRQDVGMGDRHFTAAFNVDGKGGPTSGNTTLVTLFAGNVSDVAVCGLTIERYARGKFFRPLSIFE